LIVQTTSAEAAISLLLCLYNLFEIKFQRHFRGIQLLYGVIFEDSSELSVSLRKLLFSWDYIIKNKYHVHQYQTTTATTIIDNINTTQHIVSNDPTINHSLNQTQELGKR